MFVPGLVSASEFVPLLGSPLDVKFCGVLLPGILLAELQGETPVEGAVEFSIVLPPRGDVGVAFPTVGMPGGDVNGGMDGAVLDGIALPVVGPVFPMVGRPGGDVNGGMDGAVLDGAALPAGDPPPADVAASTPDLP